ncbi:YidB family protein [Massilia sp. SR12]
MGLLDQLAGQVLGQSQGDLLSSVMGMINRAGGLQGLLQQLQAGGLAEQAASWVGTGGNHPVSGEQLEQALGSDNIAQIAQQAGLQPGQASNGLAEMLPKIIDQLTPDGQVPQNELLEQGMNLLRGKLFG